MKKIDSYILKKFLSTFFFCLILFTTIVVVVDISEKADDFTRIKLGAWNIFMQYYIGFIPFIDAFLFPLFVFISVIFFTAKMAERSEVVAILSSGVSFRRFLLPYWIGGGLLTLLLWLGYQYVLPRANAIWGTFQTVYIESNAHRPDDEMTMRRNVYLRVDNNSYAGLRYYDTVTKTGTTFFFQKFDKGQMTYTLRAGSVAWDSASQKWKLNNVVERYLGNTSERVKSSPVIYANYNIKPQELRNDEHFKERLTTRELDDYIQLEKMRGSEMLSTLEVERYNRDAIPISVLVLTIIGATLASRKVRGGSGAHLAMGFVISTLYILCSRFSLVFATKGNFTPLLAAWVPNIVFGGLAFYLYERAPK